MSTFGAVLQGSLLLLSGSVLSGCDKPKEMDELRSEAASSKEQLVKLKADLATVNGRLANLETTLGEMLIRERDRKLAALNAERKGVSNTAGPQALSQEQIGMLQKVIAQCVQVVRNSAPKESTLGSSREVYVGFDAFYNPASGRVQNNNQYVDQSAVYAFSKCMASHGWPLT
jgi:hypothetical protein